MHTIRITIDVETNIDPETAQARINEVIESGELSLEDSPNDDGKASPDGCCFVTATVID